MRQKRDIIVLKHMFAPQASVFKKLGHHIHELATRDIEVYFEDLEDKL